MQTSDARKRQAEHGLTEAERGAVSAAACGNCGERTAVLNLVARIKAEAVEAERERIAGEICDVVLNPEGEIEAYSKGFWAGIDYAARIARGEGR